jgi:hypothetical protein
MNQSHKTSSLYVFLLFILLSCNNITESKNTLLNSERIEQKFGSYGIDIVQSDNQSRVSFLYSLDPNNKNKKNYHTLAIVKFKETREVSIIHERILNGDSIGKSFKKEGWEIDKTNHQMMVISNPDKPLFKSWLPQISNENLALHFYELNVKTENYYYLYAEILEIHHPKYLGFSDITEIYSLDEETQNNEKLLSMLNFILNSKSALDEALFLIHKNL